MLSSCNAHTLRYYNRASPFAIRHGISLIRLTESEGGGPILYIESGRRSGALARRRHSRKHCGPRAHRTSCDLYRLLQVDSAADTEDIKSAYRRLARKYHPDVDGSSEAVAAFEAITTAYRILSNEHLRKQHDDHGTAAAGWQSPPDGAQRTGAACRGGDVMAVVPLEFLEAALGKEHLLEVMVKRTCADCGGRGSDPRVRPTPCSLCGGRGHVRTILQNTRGGSNALGTACPGCGASGVTRQEWCRRCGGDGRARMRAAVHVRIPAGVDEESVLRVRRQGDAGQHGGQAGDLYITFAIRPASGMLRQGLDLFSEVVVGYVDAILGGTARVPTIHGHAQLAIPPGTQAGQRLSLRGAGITPDLAVLVGEAGPLRLGAGRAQRGDHHFTVVLLLPTQVTAQERAILRGISLLESSSNRFTQSSD